MHFCNDELLALLAMIPFIGYFFRKLHAWYHIKTDHTCHEKHCDEVHVEHKFSPYHSDPVCTEKMTRVSEEDMKYLRGTPAPLHITIPVTIWDSISQNDVSERFGNDLVILLYKELANIGILDVSEEEVHWYVNDKAELWVQFRNKNFFHDHEAWGWRLG